MRTSDALWWCGLVRHDQVWPTKHVKCDLTVQLVIFDLFAMPRLVTIDQASSCADLVVAVMTDSVTCTHNSAGKRGHWVYETSAAADADLEALSLLRCPYDAFLLSPITRRFMSLARSCWRLTRMEKACCIVLLSDDAIAIKRQRHALATKQQRYDSHVHLRERCIHMLRGWLIGFKLTWLATG